MTERTITRPVKAVRERGRGTASTVASTATSIPRSETGVKLAWAYVEPDEKGPASTRLSISSREQMRRTQHQTTWEIRASSNYFPPLSRYLYLKLVPVSAIISTLF